MGDAANDSSYEPKISADGRYIVFTSRATDLIADDSNEVADIFLYDNLMQKIERISVNSQGQQANQRSFAANISADGRYVVFNSQADNLVAGDTNQRIDVFVHDRLTQQTQCLTLTEDEETSDTDNDLSSFYPAAISYDGRWVAFESEAANLVEEETNHHSDIFLYDRYYYPTFNTITKQLTIPAVTLLPDESGQAVLSLIDDVENLQFAVTIYKKLNKNTFNIKNLFNPNTQMLYLPKVEVLDEQGKMHYFYVEMQFDILTGYLTVSHIQHDMETDF
jgi:Tol biopolymer transport system component